MVLVILGTEFYILEKASLRFRQQESAPRSGRRVRAVGHPLRSFAEWLPHAAPTSHPGGCPRGWHAPGPCPGCLCAVRTLARDSMTRAVGAQRDFSSCPRTGMAVPPHFLNFLPLRQGQ
jgi:hypothetical protein